MGNKVLKLRIVNHSSRSMWFQALMICTFTAMSVVAYAQDSEKSEWLANVSNEYAVVPDLTYLTASNWENKIDLYLPRNAEGPTPTVMYFHGGGWVRGNKDSNVLRLLPYLEMGWSVVNVAYRLGPVALAPAAVEDCLCALRWVIRNAEQYNFDPTRIIVTGNSAGGHLALTTGMAPASMGLDRQCPGDEPLKVAAIINWYGITDVGDLLQGSNTKSYAVEWLGSLPDRLEIADRVSPINYVRAGIPPILTIHGDADPTVPYQHAIQLHQALDGINSFNQLHTVPGGRHGGFNETQTASIFKTIYGFLSEQGLGH